MFTKKLFEDILLWFWANLEESVRVRVNRITWYQYWSIIKVEISIKLNFGQIKSNKNKHANFRNHLLLQKVRDN